MYSPKEQAAPDGPRNSTHKNSRATQSWMPTPVVSSEHPAVAQGHLQTLADHSTQVQQANELQLMADNFTSQKIPIQRKEMKAFSGSIHPPNDEVIQRMVLTLHHPQSSQDSKEEQKQHKDKSAVLDLEENDLAAAYNSSERTLRLSQMNRMVNIQTDSVLLDNKGIGNEILVINAHGSNGTLAGRTAEEILTLMNRLGISGYSEIHIYGCQSGIPALKVASTISKKLGAKVWAPNGNTAFNTQKRKYQVSRMKLEEKESRYVVDSDSKDGETLGENEAWSYYENGQFVKTGTPNTPNGFGQPEEASADLTDWMSQITLENEDEEASD